MLVVVAMTSMRITLMRFDALHGSYDFAKDDYEYDAGSALKNESDLWRSEHCAVKIFKTSKQFSTTCHGQKVDHH